MARLVVNPGSPVAWEIQLKPGANLIGRGFANDFKIADPSVSSSHCQITVDSHGIFIKDLGSTNGTFVNRAMVKEAPLRSGQTIHLGGVELLFDADAAAPLTAPQLVPTVPPVGRAAPAIGSGGPTVFITRPVPTPGNAAVVPPAKPGTNPVIPITIPPAPIQFAPLGTSAAVPAPHPPTALGAPQSLTPPPPPTLSIAAPRAVALAAPVPVAPALPSPPPMSSHAPAAVHAVPAAAPGSNNCKFHPKTIGRYLCNKCRHYFCELCVTSRGPKKFCRHCGSECVPVQVRLERPTEAGFFSRIPGAFAYPFRGSGFFMMLIGIVIFAGLKYGRYLMFAGGIRPFVFGSILQVFSGGYLFTFLQSIIHATTAGDREMPDLPGMSNFVDDILMPFLRLLGLVLICFTPVIGLAIWQIYSAETALTIPLIAAAVLGFIYFPMAFLAVAILDSAGAANPLVIVPSMLKVPLEYFVTLILLAAVFGFRGLGDPVIGAAFPRGLLSHSMAEMFAYIAANAFWGFASFYLLIVAIHILAQLYVAKRQKLGWLNR